jgi:hypothetical protein
MREDEIVDILELLDVVDEEVRVGDWIKFTSLGQYWTGKTQVGDIGIVMHKFESGAGTIKLNAYTPETIMVHCTAHDQVFDHVEKISYHKTDWLTILYYSLRRLFVSTYARFI